MFHFTFLTAVLIVGIFHRFYPFACYLHVYDMIKRMSKISLDCSCPHKCPLFDSVSKSFMAFEMSCDILLFPLAATAEDHNFLHILFYLSSLCQYIRYPKMPHSFSFQFFTQNQARLKVIYIGV